MVSRTQCKHLYVKSGNPSCISFLDVARKKTHREKKVKTTIATVVGVDSNHRHKGNLTNVKKLRDFSLRGSVFLLPADWTPMLQNVTCETAQRAFVKDRRNFARKLRTFVDEEQTDRRCPDEPSFVTERRHL